MTSDFSAHLWDRPNCGNRPSWGTHPSCESYIGIMATCIFNIDLSKLLAPRDKTDESGPVCAQAWSGAPTRGEKYIQQGPILPEIVTSQFVHNMAALHANLR